MENPNIVPMIDCQVLHEQGVEQVVDSPPMGSYQYIICIHQWGDLWRIKGNCLTNYQWPHQEWHNQSCWLLIWPGTCPGVMISRVLTPESWTSTPVTTQRPPGNALGTLFTKTSSTTSISMNGLHVRSTATLQEWKEHPYIGKTWKTIEYPFLIFFFYQVPCVHHNKNGNLLEKKLFSIFFFFFCQ